MTIFTFFAKLKAHLPLPLQFLREVLHYWLYLCQYNASRHTDLDMRKMQYTLMRENHVIEKGMSMRNVRRGFGQQKVVNLLSRLEKYYQRYGLSDIEFLRYPITTIDQYIQYQQRNGVSIPHIIAQFEQLCQQTNIYPSAEYKAGVDEKSKSDIQQSAAGNFGELVYSRHSIRYFQSTEMPVEKIEQALHLAARTPSACNRQAWHTHIYNTNDTHRLLEMQGGCNGFYQDIPFCIVVTADMKGFLGHEPFQCYIDGGLYAQNLINALHYVGLGTIPLSCGFMSGQLRQMQQQFDIPKNEVMIVIIGLGEMYDHMRVAESTRKPISFTNRYH